MSDFQRASCESNALIVVIDQRRRAVLYVQHVSILKDDLKTLTSIAYADMVNTYSYESKMCYANKGRCGRCNFRHLHSEVLIRGACPMKLRVERSAIQNGAYAFIRGNTRVFFALLYSDDKGDLLNTCQ